MTRPLVGPYSGPSKAWTEFLAERSLNTVIQRQSTAREQESSVPLHPRTSIEVILHIETLQVRVKSGPTVSHDFIKWPKTNSPQLPAVVAYDGDKPLWGFGVLAGVPKGANLSASLEPDG